MHSLFQHIIVLGLLLTGIADVYSQEENNLWRGNKAYHNREYDKALQSYENSLNLLPSDDATYNKANSLYRQKKYADAAKLFESVTNHTEDKELKAKAFHNLGNSLLKSEQLDKGIEAYKNALRNNPNDEDTRYNLSYALNLKKKQEEEKENQDDQDQDKDQDKDKEKEQNQDDQKDQEKDDQENQNDKEQEQDQDKDRQEEEEQQSKPNEISKEDAERMLENLENEEEKTQEKVKMKQRKSSNIKIENDW